MKQFLITSILIVASVSVFCQDNSQTRKTQFNLNKQQIAINGYDPVAYITMNKATKGNATIVAFNNGVGYYFTSAENRELFKKDPNKYEPQYGGWCAYAMGNDGSKVEIDPETFKIVNNKLYLFYNKYFTNTLKSWNKNESTLMMNADKNWMKFYKP